MLAWQQAGILYNVKLFRKLRITYNGLTHNNTISIAVAIAGIMIDLNGFKQINDNYGHSEGDAALMIVADVLRKSFSEYGVVTRYAG